MFFIVNHDQGNLHLKDRDVYTDFEVWDYPFVGIQELLLCLAVNAPPDLYARGKDLVLNLHINVAQTHSEVSSLSLSLCCFVSSCLHSGRICSGRDWRRQWWPS